MNHGWALAGGLVGIPIGAALRGVVYRNSVPSGSPLRTACPSCGQELPRWLLRCGRCRGRITVPLVFELATATVLALILGRFAGQWELGALAFLGVLGVALATIDVAVQRLPDRLTLPAYPIVAALLGIAAILDGDVATLGRALLGGLVLATSFYLLAALRPGALGLGDVKLAGLLGLALGWLGWPVLITGAALSFVLFAVVSLVLLAARRITLRSHIAFGPFMLAGALIAAVAL
ncbi:MAG: prepilin peptidase [Actinophytocola sp.]|nr:prepilin peptidase [Actinophytocola sp.]